MEPRQGAGTAPPRPIQALISKTKIKTTLDELVKSRHSRAGGNPESAKILKGLDSRFHRGNDGIAHFQTFYETINTLALRKKEFRQGQAVLGPGAQTGPLGIMRR